MVYNTIFNLKQGCNTVSLVRKIDYFKFVMSPIQPFHLFIDLKSMQIDKYVQANLCILVILD